MHTHEAVSISEVASPALAFFFWIGKWTPATTHNQSSTIPCRVANRGNVTLLWAVLPIVMVTAVCEWELLFSLLPSGLLKHLIVEAALVIGSLWQLADVTEDFLSEEKHKWSYGKKK